MYFLFFSTLPLAEPKVVRGAEEFVALNLTPGPKKTDFLRQRKIRIPRVEGYVRSVKL